MDTEGQTIRVAQLKGETPMGGIGADDELIREYLVESNEHLSTIENDLVQVEQDGAAIDEELVNRVFRAAHSIKGGAGFFHLTQIRELSHRTENVLDMIRSRQMIPTPEVISVLLMAFDRLREMLGNWAASNEMEIGDYVEALAGLAAQHLEEGQREGVHARVALALPGRGRLIELTQLDLEQARRGGRTIYYVEFDLIRDLQRKERSPIQVMSQLTKCGTILEAQCDFEAVGTLEEAKIGRLLFEVVYATALEPELINQLLDIPAESIHVVERQGGVRSLARCLEGSSRGEEAVPSNPLPAPVRETPRAVAAESTIRLNVELLDSLMNLAGEMVLSRNQLNEAVQQGDMGEVRASAHRLSLVTSELQATVALTRMQPVGSLFAKFPRVVRELARELGKEAQLQSEGGEVEIDKSILEGLSDPLTHMIRNAVDHGLESPEDRRAAGKPAMGTVVLRARHQAGQVVIEISDNGRGLDGDKVAASMLRKGMITAEQVKTMSERDKRMLILLPGVSTAEKLSNISGRGVGMDVVKTNLDKLGGKIEIDSVVGAGTSFRIKLPLTLAIIPSLLVSAGGQRFAIPQISVSELIRIPAGQKDGRVDVAGGRPVLLLRDRLVPLVHLREVLGGTAQDPAAVWHVVLVDAGAMQYGLVVEGLHDTVEIVVKPLGRHLQGLRDYAGATILGDGRVALILDVAGLGARAGLRAGSGEGEALGQQEERAVLRAEQETLLVFDNAPGERCALPIEMVTRIERVGAREIELLGGRRIWRKQDEILPVLELTEQAGLRPLEETQQWVLVVFQQQGRQYGLLAAEPIDLIETEWKLDAETLRQPGIAGSTVIREQTTLLVDLAEVAGRHLAPATQWAGEAKAGHAGSENGGEAASGPGGHKGVVLVAEDSDFFRGQIRRLVEAVGYRVLAAGDGEQAWDLLNAHAGEVGVVATDIEMPHLSGLELTERIRRDERFGQLPVIALSSLAAEAEVERGLAAGVTEYQVKLNPDQLIASIDRWFEREGKQG